MLPREGRMADAPHLAAGLIRLPSVSLPTENGTVAATTLATGPVSNMLGLGTGRGLGGGGGFMMHDMAHSEHDPPKFQGWNAVREPHLMITKGCAYASHRGT